MRKLNLLHVVLDMDIGGLQRLVSDMSLEMNHDLYNIEVCCFNTLGCFAEKLRDHGIKVTLLQKNQTRFDKWYVFRLARFLSKKKIDILHMHTGSFFFGTLAAVLARIPATVYTEHGRTHLESRVRLYEDRFVSLFVDKIVAVSSDLEPYLSEQVKLPARKICTVINGIQTKQFLSQKKNSNLLVEFQIPPECKIIGTVGRLDDVKDQFTLIKAFQLVHMKEPNSRLLIVGDGPLREKLDNHIDKNNMSGKIIITGRRNDIPELLSLFDIFVLSSLAEGTSVSLLEAMAAAVPPIVTDVGGNGSIVTNNQNGLLVEPKKPEQIAEAITDLLSNADKYERLSIAATSTVRDKYSLKVMIEQYIDLYRNILSKKYRYRDQVYQ